MPDETAPTLGFELEVIASRVLPLDADHHDVLVTVTADAAPAPALPLAETLIMDRSLSMNSDSKILAAKDAACAAVDALPDGSLLALVAGDSEATVIYPPGRGMAAVDDAVRQAARDRIRRLMCDGGTRIGQWLTAAAARIAEAPHAGVLRHAILYTDGKNEHESDEELGRALALCADQFTCDVRGVGNEWEHTVILRIAAALHGDAAAILDIADLTEDFTTLIRRAQRQAVSRSYLRLCQFDDGFRVEEARQAIPDEAELSIVADPEDPGVLSLALGPWEPAQSRTFELSLSLDRDQVPLDENRRAMRVELVVELPDGSLRCVKHAPVPYSRRRLRGPEPDTAAASLTVIQHQRELGMAMRAAARELAAGRDNHAKAELAVAFRLARALGDSRLEYLERVASPGPDGDVTLRPDLTPGEIQQLGVDSTKTSWTTSRAPGPGPGEAGAGETGPDLRVCAACLEPNQPGNACCVHCGHRLDAEDTS